MRGGYKAGGDTSELGGHVVSFGCNKARGCDHMERERQMRAHRDAR